MNYHNKFTDFSGTLTSPTLILIHWIFIKGMNNLHPETVKIPKTIRRSFNNLNVVIDSLNHGIS